MRKEDSPRIELLQAVYPVRGEWQGLSMTISLGSPGKNVAAICRGGVVTLSRDDHIAVWAADDKRLVSHCVAGRRDQEDARKYLGLAVEFLVPSTFNQLRQGVVRACPRC